MIEDLFKLPGVKPKTLAIGLFIVIVAGTVGGGLFIQAQQEHCEILLHRTEALEKDLTRILTQHAEELRLATNNLSGRITELSRELEEFRSALQHWHHSLDIMAVEVASN